MKLKFAFQDCLAQFELEGAAHLHARVHFGFEKPERAAAVRLGAVECEVRVLHECIRCSAIGRRDGNTDAGANHNLMTLDVVGSADDLNQAGCERVGIEALRGRNLNDRELVATQSGDNIRIANASTHAVSRSLQESIADRMSKRVIHALEVVKIKAENRNRLGTAHVTKDRFHTVVKCNAIGQIRECVVIRQMLDALFGGQPFGDVLEGHDETAARPWPIQYRDTAAIGQALNKCPAFALSIYAVAYG